MSISPEQAHDFLRSRRSVRRFDGRPVRPEVLRRILDTGRWAPSAHNRQPWRLAVLTESGVKTRLAEQMGVAFRRDLSADGLASESIDRQVSRSRARIQQAPALVILCLTMVEMDRYPDRRRRRAEFRMALQSVALLGGQVLLAAHGEGLGGVWVCAPLFAPEAVCEALELPAGWEPQGMLLLGHPQSIPDARQRKELDEITVFIDG